MYIGVSLFMTQAVTTLLPFVSKRLVSMTASDVRVLLQEPNPLLTSLSQQFNDSANHIGTSYCYYCYCVLMLPLGIGPVILNYYPSKSQSDQAEEEPLYVGLYINNQYNY